MTTKQHDIFISYSRKDTEVMQKIRDEFIANGIRVWTDEIYLDVGTDDWLKEIKKAIKNSRGMIIICSPSSEQSKWVGIEITLASENDLIIIPYWVEGKNATDSIPTLITNYQRIDARSNKFGKIAELIQSVKKKLNISDVKPSPKPAEQPQSKPVTQSQPIPKNKPEQQSKSVAQLQQIFTIRKLEAKNPIDWLVLLWWILVTPQKIEAYKSQYGYEKQIGDITYNYSGLANVGNWLFSTLLWLPFIISLSAVSLGLVPIASQDIASHTPPILLGIVIGLWFSTGFFGGKSDNFIGVIVAGVSIGVFVIGSLVGNVSMFLVIVVGVWVIIAGSIVGNVSIIGIVGFTGGIFVVIAGSVSMGIIGLNAILIPSNSFILIIFSSIIIAGIVAFIATSTLDVGLGMFFVINLYCIVLGIGIMVVINTHDWGLALRASITSLFTLAIILGVLAGSIYLIDKTKWGGKLILVALPLIYAFLIWIYYFGGWRVFVPVAS